MASRDLARIALFAAIVAALGLFPAIVVPGVPVPVTAQTLGVMLAGSILGAKRGGLSVLTFLVLVAVGLPLLAGGRGGPAPFLSPSGGFLLAWPLGAFVVGLLTERFGSRLTLPAALLCNVAGGIAVIYALGIPFAAAVGRIGLGTAAAGSLAFLPGDLLKAGAAAAAAVTVRRAYPLQEAH